MFVYEKKLQYPVNIKQTNAKLAKIIITQYGGAYSKTYRFFVNSWGNPKNEIKIFNKRQKIKLSLVFLIDRQTYVKYDCENA